MFKAVSLISASRIAAPVGVVHAVDVSGVERVLGTRPTWLQRLRSIVGLILVVWAVPLFVLAVPLALGWRAVLEMTKWRNRRGKLLSDMSPAPGKKRTVLRRSRVSGQLSHRMLPART